MYVMGTGSKHFLIHEKAKEIYANLEAYCLSLFEAYPSMVLISGMAEGWDEAIAKVGMRNEIPYIVAIPNPGYGDYYWKRNSLLGVDRSSTWNQLVEGATERVIISQTLYVNGLHANFVRNQWMVDKCDRALVFKSTSPGTRDAISRLTTAGKPWEESPFDLQGELPL